MKPNRPTRAAIDSFCGIFKTKPGAKPVTQQLLDDRAEDSRREEAKWERLHPRSAASKRGSR